MRILHTSDWHLGHTLRGEVARDHEHQAFLAWLLATCVREAPDVLLITGDVFDSATPTASAERMWFEFLAAARRAHPMEIIAIAGNHDSPARLGASSSVLRELGVHVIGSLPRRADGAIDLERVLIPVAAGRGLVAAVPFLRPVDLGAQDDALEAVYGEVLAGARARRGRHQALIATGHLYVAGADAQFLSERRVSVGGQESAPLRLFPDDLSYVALGHVHRAQRVGRETIRYAGAPIPLALDEASYRHQVVVADFAGDRAVEIRAVPIPRAVEIVRVPKRGDFFKRAQSGDLGEKAKQERNRFPMKHPYALGMRPLIFDMVPLQGTRHKMQSTGIGGDLSDPQANADAIKALGYYLGADFVGICRAEPWMYYSHDEIEGKPLDAYHDYAVVMLIDQGFETMEGASGDDWISASQSMRAYMRGAEIAGVMAAHCRRMGFSSRSHTNAHSEVI
ncbi:MAG: exonuclease subunit SbcD, partial [Deltaproteobacteria bacterium]|nr:exonuclease subunit SbcD [Deltaproteobacteria bacterium]